MKVIATKIPDLLILEPAVFSDDRGFFLETYRKSHLKDHGVTVEFCQDNHSRSAEGTLRGLHYQRPHTQAKLVSVVRGKILDVAVDIRRGSPTFGQHVSVELSESNHLAFFIPEGFAHGFCTYEESDVVYKCSRYYSAESDKGIAWNDPDLGIEWPRSSPLVSAKDQHLPLLKEVQPADLPCWEDPATD